MAVEDLLSIKKQKDKVIIRVTSLSDSLDHRFEIPVPKEEYRKAIAQIKSGGSYVFKKGANSVRMIGMLNQIRVEASDSVIYHIDVISYRVL